MNLEEALLIKLIKQSQFGASEVIDFSCADMTALYNEASQQAVLGIIASEIPIELSDEKWQKAKNKQLFNYIRYCHAQDEIIQLLESAFIPFVILKGNASAIYYNDPTLRIMGDIDLLVPSELYERTKALLSSSGYIEDHDNGRHSVFKKDGYTYEVHHHFSHEIYLEDVITSGLDFRVYKTVDGHIFPMLPKLANGLILLDHFRSHIQAAVGFRQIVDWMMFVYRELDDEFWNNEFQPIMHDRGMEKLAITLTRMCQLYLGLPDDISWCKSADESLCKMILDSVISTGNFGEKNGSGTIIESVGYRIKSKGLFYQLQHAGENNWEAYKSHRFLKPFCWFYQLIRYISKCIKSGRSLKQIKSDNLRSKQRYELIKKLMSD